MNARKKIGMLTRVEGHGSVELIRDGGRVVDARLTMNESPRLFEALLVGRNYDEIPDIACRICSICSTVHKVAALQAVEQALGVVVSPQTGLLRELAVQGGQIESHALHIFCLALPDYLGVNGFQALARCVPEKLQLGLGIKKLGNLIQETVGGRAIHPFNLMVGGVGKAPTADQLRSINDQLYEVSDDVADCIEYICGLDEILPPLQSAPACAVSGGPQLFGKWLSTATPEIISADRAVEWLNEQVETYTHAKVSCFDETGPYMVGPLARVIMSSPPEYAALFDKPLVGSSLKARVVELKAAVVQAQLLIEQILSNGLSNEMPVAAIIANGEGVSLMEAPRGVLLHSYRFNGNGKCLAANIITPTAINQRAIAGSLKGLIKWMEGADCDQIRVAAEILIRCYDPCISCAVH